MNDHWHKHYHGRILNSYSKMSVELRGAAYTLLDMMYDAGGPLPDSDAVIAAKMLCSIRKWRAYKEELLSLGKFRLTPDGNLTNSLLEIELKKRGKLAEFGSIGGRKKAENEKKRKQFKEGDVATLQATLLAKDVAKPLAEPLALEERGKMLEADASNISEDKSSGADAPPSDRQFVWSVGKAILREAGLEAKAAGSLLGAIVEAVGLAEARNLIIQAEKKPPLDARTWLASFIHKKPAKVEPRPDPTVIAPTKKPIFDDAQNVIGFEDTTTGERMMLRRAG